jgi:alpha-L-fucosidase
LIERYRPSIMWNDIGYPAAADVPTLFATYYNTLPDGVINDRFRQAAPGARESGDRGIELPANQHFDFRTPEYTTYDEIQPEKWESTRGLGFSFGYNLNEDVEHYLTSTN